MSQASLLMATQFRISPLQHHLKQCHLLNVCPPLQAKLNLVVRTKKPTLLNVFSNPSVHAFVCVDG